MIPVTFSRTRGRDRRPWKRALLLGMALAGMPLTGCGGGAIGGALGGIGRAVGGVARGAAGLVGGAARGVGRAAGAVGRGVANVAGGVVRGAGRAVGGVARGAGRLLGFNYAVPEESSPQPRAARSSAPFAEQFADLDLPSVGDGPSLEVEPGEIENKEPDPEDEDAEEAEAEDSAEKPAERAPDEDGFVPQETAAESGPGQDVQGDAQRA